MKKVLLLGSAGQLGTDILRYTSSKTIKIIPSIRSDFDADIDSIDDKLSKYKDCDYLINCIAYHKVDQCEDNAAKAYDINADFVRRLALFTVKHNMTLIHFSTDYVFDGLKNKLHREVDETAPLNVYGSSKRNGEQLLHAYGKKYFIFRVSSLFGSKESSEHTMNFIEKMVHAANSGQKLNVIDNQIISPTHAKDVALALKKIIDTGYNNYGLYHCCNSGTCSWYQFAKKIFDICQINADLTAVSYDSFHTHAKRPQFCAMNNSKISKVYTMKRWEEALDEYLELKGYKAS